MLSFFLNCEIQAKSTANTFHPHLHHHNLFDILPQASNVKNLSIPSRSSQIQLINTETLLAMSSELLTHQMVLSVINYHQKCPDNMAMTTAWRPFFHVIYNPTKELVEITSKGDIYWVVKFYFRWSPIHVQNSFKDFQEPSRPVEAKLREIVNWHLQSRRPRSCHVRSRADHRRHPRGHLWRRGRPARGPLAPLSVWTTALWAGHGLGAGGQAHIHTAAATATRCPRRARHWPAWPGKQWRRKTMSW